MPRCPGSRLFTCLLVVPLAALAAAGPCRAAPPQAVPPEFQKAGVCARCHVVSVLEWGISSHVAAETDCQQCHGPSAGHVANERNEVKPDRLPRGAAIARRLCSSCHDMGCPKTLRTDACQSCHHVHALINPASSAGSSGERADQLLRRWQRFQQKMAEGNRHVERKDWHAAQLAFDAALQLIPGQHQARKRSEMCRRRMNPAQPGVRIVGDRFDAETGLARQVRVELLDLPMLLVPPGSFDLGSDQLPASRPVHTVDVDAFYLGQYEVTQAQWQQVMGSNPSAHQGDAFPRAASMPVERVSWDDCQEFVRRLNGRVAGGGFRLPTEAEWEYACRAAGLSGGSPAAAGDVGTGLKHLAWYRGNSAVEPIAENRFVQVDAFAPRPVGRLQPNAWGFYDMRGNVNEWCSSLMRPYLYLPRDGREALDRPGPRVLRGGGFADSAESLDPALRHAARPTRRLRWNGLRLARDAVENRE